MKKLIYVLAIMAMFLPACAYDQAEFDAFSAGVLSVRAPDAALSVSGDRLIISEPADRPDYIYTDSPIDHAEDLVVAANHIADHFPNEFRAIEGHVLNQNNTPIATVILYLPIPELPPIA
jgi:hypothetical protein